MSKWSVVEMWKNLKEFLKIASKRENAKRVKRECCNKANEIYKHVEIIEE